MPTIIIKELHVNQINLGENFELHNKFRCESCSLCEHDEFKNLISELHQIREQLDVLTNKNSI